MAPHFQTDSIQNRIQATSNCLLACGYLHTVRCVNAQHGFAAIPTVAHCEDTSAAQAIGIYMKLEKCVGPPPDHSCTSLSFHDYLRLWHSRLWDFEVVTAWDFTFVNMTLCSCDCLRFHIRDWHFAVVTAYDFTFVNMMSLCSWVCWEFTFLTMRLYSCDCLGFYIRTFLSLYVHD